MLTEFPVAEGGTPVAEKLAGEVISLPMHAYLDEPTQDRIIAAVLRDWNSRAFWSAHCLLPPLSSSESG